MANIDIKTALKEARVFQWEVAKFLNIGESVLSRMMRQELQPEKKRRNFTGNQPDKGGASEFRKIKRNKNGVKKQYFLIVFRQFLGVFWKLFRHFLDMLIFSNFVYCIYRRSATLKCKERTKPHEQIKKQEF